MDIKAPVISLTMITPGPLHPLPTLALSSIVVTLLRTISVTVTWPAVPGSHSIPIVPVITPLTVRPCGVVQADLTEPTIPSINMF